MSLIEGSELLTVDPDGSAVGLVDPVDEVEERALAAAALAHDSHGFPLSECDTDVAQHGTRVPSWKLLERCFKRMNSPTIGDSLTVTGASPPQILSLLPETAGGTPPGAGDRSLG